MEFASLLFPAYIVLAALTLALFAVTRKKKHWSLFASFGQFVGGGFLLWYVLEDWLRGLVIAFALWLLAGSAEEFKYWLRDRAKNTSADEGEGQNRK